MRVSFGVLPGNLVGPGSAWGWGWTVLGFLALFALWGWRAQDLRGLRRVGPSSLAGFALLALLTALTPTLSWERFSGLPFRVGFPLFLWLPYLIWGGQLGPGAAGLIGLLAGAAAGFLQDGRFLHLPWIVALDAALISALLFQNDVGRPFRILRQPLVAAGIGWVGWWLLQAISWGAFYPSWPEALDGIWTLTAVMALPSGLSALVCGGIAQALHARWPERFRTRQPPRWPFYALRIQIRFLVFFSLWVSALILALFGVVSALAIRQAYEERAQALDRGVRRAAEQLTYFLHTGDTLLMDLAALGVPPDAMPVTVALILQRFVQTGPIYQTVLWVDERGEVQAAYPVEEQGRGLSVPERAAMAQAQLAQSVVHTAVHRLPDGQAGLSFVAPLAGEPVRGFLIGRVRVAQHPALREVLASLSEIAPAGQAFLVDREGRILLHPEAGVLLDLFPLPAALPAGTLVQPIVSPSGTVEEVLLRRLPGTDWWAVIRYPRAALIRRAAERALPAGGILLGFSLIGALLFGIVSRLLARRLERLARAAGRMAGGDLEAPILSDGPDEIGQLAEAMEHARHGLRARMADLSLLLELNRRLMEVEDLARGLPEVARALERATAASLVRLLLPGPGGSLRVFTAAGEVPPEPLDHACWEQVDAHTEPVWIGPGVRPDDLAPALRSERAPRVLGVFPIHLGEERVGAAWLAFPSSHRAGSSERQLTRLILSQAAVFIARARLYEAITAERERLRAVLESSPDPLMLVDARGNLLDLNPAAERFLGTPTSRALGQPLAALLRDTELLALLQEAVPPGQVRSRELHRADGRVLWAGRYDLRLRDGREIGRLLFLRDITPFKALDRLKSDLIAAISHDLRSPLTYMRGFVTMLGMAGPLTSRQQEYVEKIMGGIDQMTRMIEDLMDLRRIEEGIGQRGICRLGDLIRDVFHEFRPQAMARGLRMTMEVKAPGVVHGDPAWLRRAIANLVDNAIKYTPEGGTITIGLTEAGGEAVIWVRDTGIGIAPGDQARIFEKFYRARRQETAHVKGSGLGLALVKSIAEWHGGRVWVESRLGHGSTFYLAIPQALPSDASQGTRNR